MLMALDRGVKGGKWFSLIDKVYNEGNLRAAFKKVKGNKGAAGVDHQTVAKFEERLVTYLVQLKEALRQDTYQPQAIRRVWIPKPGSKEKRPLGIPTVRDRVVQTALRNVLEPIFEKGFAPNSYGFRPGRGCKDALRQVERLLQAGYRYVVDADLKSYFDTIPHHLLMEQVETKVSDGRVLRLIERYLKQGVLEPMKAWLPEAGTPQGAVISPMLANIYLNPLDHAMEKTGRHMIRYADDFVVLCRTQEEAHSALETVQQWVADNKLALHPEKTKIVDVQAEGFDFLGYHFWRHTRWPRDKSLQKLKDAIRAKTSRTSGQSLSMIIQQTNPKLRGWFEYFKHSNRRTFRRLDSWIRMRLRSILRKRVGLRGRGRGQDHHRWTNAFFATHGLFSLTAAYESIHQSARR
tara:strand:+ start:447 stop:1667 length:1221 start_codon:yes stop_codon:yes gene_type:complete